MNADTSYKLLIVSLFLFASFCFFSCNDNDDTNTDENSNHENFSLMGEKFQISTCKITNHGREKGLYIFTVELNSKNNDKQIYLKFRSINDKFKDIFNRDYTCGETPDKYSSESYVKIGTTTYNLSDGNISIISNYISFEHRVPNICLRIKSNTQDGNLIEGTYEGSYDYVDISNSNDYYEVLGDGSVSFSYTNKTYPLNSGFLYYYGFDTDTKKRNYKLYLVNENGDYLQFFFSSEDILGANINYVIGGYEWFHESYNQSHSWMINLKDSFPYPITDGSIGINKTGNHYDITIQCGYNIYKPFQIEGTYTGNLIYFDFSSSLIDYKGKNYQIESVELTYDGEYRNLYRYGLSIKTTKNDKINLKLFTDKRELSESYVFDEIVRESVLYDSYDSFIDISGEPYVGFWHTGEMTIDTPDKTSSSVKLDFIGRDEAGNFINIIYHGLMTIK
jgi:hypothetical protein